ncbi:MAG: hypothetical protein AAFZ18_14105 [Myxococcota bacterium]
MNPIPTSKPRPGSWRRLLFATVVLGTWHCDASADPEGRDGGGPPPGDLSFDLGSPGQDLGGPGPDLSASDLGAGKTLGAGCSDGSECASTFCAESPFGGICGECLDDTHCPWGCRPPALLGLGDAAPSVCDDGAPGARCQTEMACQVGLYCGRNPFTVPLGSDDSLTCAACRTDRDCGEGDEVCAIAAAAPGDRLTFACVSPGVVATGELCDLEGSGDAACAGWCVAAQVSGPIEIVLGVCSDCRTDADCPGSQSCRAPVFDIMGGMMATGGRCE